MVANGRGHSTEPLFTSPQGFAALFQLIVLALNDLVGVSNDEKENQIQHG